MIIRVVAMVATLASVHVMADSCQQEVNCKLPDCFCPTFEHPLGAENIPQIVYFGFDDAVQTQVSEWYDQLFTSSRKNPNGCPITMSLYVQNQYTEYDRVATYYKAGHEIAVHSVTHQDIDTAAKLQEEGKEQRDNLINKAGVPAADVVGWRSPNLKTAGDDQPRVLQDLGYLYDISLTYARDVSAPWPFTLDFGYPYPCQVQPCPSPTAGHPGFWEIMVHALQDEQAGRPCVYVDACTPEPESQAEEYLWSNFLHNYETNRAPFGLNMHAAWFARPEYLSAMGKFIDRLLATPDVYIVNVRQMIEWMKAPATLTEITSFAPWSCGASRHQYLQRPHRHPTPRPTPRWRPRPTHARTQRPQIWETPWWTPRLRTQRPTRPTTRRPITRRPTTRRTPRPTARHTARPTHPPTHRPTERPTTIRTHQRPTNAPHKVPFWYKQPTDGTLTYPVVGNENNHTSPNNLSDLLMPYIRDHGVVTSPPTTRYQNIDGARCVQEVNCRLPECLCRSLEPPIHIGNAGATQIVYIAIDSKIDGNSFAQLEKVFSSSRKNPNGCPISGTVFVPSSGNYSPYVKSLKSRGVRVGCRGGSYRERYSGWTLRSKVSEELKSVRSSSSASGWRGLANMAPTDDVFQTLVDETVKYDSSIISGDFETPWPYTLDFGLGDKCAVRQNTCPSGRYPGLWEIPVKPLVVPRSRSSCSFPDTCPDTVNSASFIKQLLDSNFRRHYHSNRAPFGINLHDTWFANSMKENSLNGLIDFLDGVLTNDDVVVLSIEQMLEWISLPNKSMDNIGC